jgi:bifunctional non-homologous end joining protein LigD
LIDGEAVACDANGLAVFEHLRRKREGRHVFLCAFDLLELDGKDLSREPLKVRKATLATGAPSRPAVQSASDAPGDIVFRHACAMGLEGIVSKRLRLKTQTRPDWRFSRGPLLVAS